MVWSRLLTGAFVIAAAAAHAQSSMPPASGNPATKLRYQSAFSDYRPYTDAEVVSWKQANGDAALLGGHMGQMKHDAMPAMVRMPDHPTPPAVTSPAPGSPGPAAATR